MVVPSLPRTGVTLVPLSGNHHAVVATRRLSDRRGAMLRLLVIEASSHSPRWYGAKNCMLVRTPATRAERERDADDLRTLRLLS